MNYKLLLLTLLSALTLGAKAQHIDRPQIEGPTSFAVITDRTTYERCREQITLYKQTIESE